jgi:ribonucleotide reductase alpha subunit
MFVIKRNGSFEEVNFNKVVQRLKFISSEPYPLTEINVHTLAQTVIQGLHNNIQTRDIDIYSANICASMSIKNHQYGILAGRIIIHNHHKNTLTSFKDKMDKLYLRKDKHGNICPLLDEKFYKFVLKNQKEIESHIDYSRDFLLDYFSFKTLERSYLLKLDQEIIERPQDMFMRVSIFIHMNPKLISKEKTKPILERIFETYDLMSNKYFTHATPTLFNAGTNRPGMLSCFLLGTEDSLEGILKTVSDCAQISKWSGGIGFHISNWRSRGALIRGTNGASSGIIPFLKIFNDTARAFNQGGKRPGSFAAYIEMHHPDIMDFLQLRKNHGEENLRCRDLFLGLWVCDLFMERVRDNQDWSLFDPDECPGLSDVYGENYRKLYLEYEEKKMYREQLPAREVWKAVFTSQKESGIPYILYKDRINSSNNQSNIGVIKSSNLCVTGDTLILTEEGYYPIRDLTRTNPVHNVWNGEEFTPATFAKTGEKQKIMEITVQMAKKEISNHRISQLSSDFPLDRLHYTSRMLRCTPYHKFILEDETVIEASELQPGMKLLEWNNPQGNFRVYSYITKVEYLDEPEDTYCFNEPKLHRGVFNSILTQNCSEIVEVSNSEEYACCTLASICLSMFVEDTHGEDDLDRPLNHEFPKRPVMNYKKLMEVVQVIVRNLNQVIDRNWYPTDETEKSNSTHRPLGIGVQGLADVFYKFRCTYDSALARELNQRIFETIYYAAVSASTKLAKEIYKSYLQQLDPKNPNTLLKIDKKEYSIDNLPKTIGSYSSMNRNNGSPLFNGKFHWELYGKNQNELLQKFDWDSLRAHIQTFGIRNSLLIALMPTASTSQIMGNIESIEPLTSNVFKRQTLAGEFIVINKYLMNDLTELNLWNAEMENYIKLSNGSIQNIQGIPDDIKNLYRTVWEISQQHIIDLAADRQAFVDQSQSMNLFIEDLTFSKFNSMHFYSWNKGLKTGCYYLRTRPAVQAQKFTVQVQPSSQSVQAQSSSQSVQFNIPEQNEEEICLVCSS